MQRLYKQYCISLKLFIIFLILSSSVAAQDFKEALLKMKNIYASASNLRVVMSIKAFDAKSPEYPFYNQKAEVKKEGQRYFYEFDGMTMVLNENYLVMVNQKLKQILFTRNKTAAVSQFEKQFKFNIDSLLTAYGKSSYEGRENGLDHFRIIHQNGVGIQKTDMYFLVNDGQLKIITYSYSNGQRVTIDFEAFETNPVFTDNTFSENEYFGITNNRLSPTKKYLQYKIVDTEKANKPN